MLVNLNKTRSNEGKNAWYLQNTVGFLHSDAGEQSETRTPVRVELKEFNGP